MYDEKAKAIEVGEDREPGRFNTRLVELDLTAERLEDTVRRLETRLRPITQSEETVPEPDGLVAMRQPESEYGDRVRSATDSIGRSIARLASLHDRCEA